MALERELDMFVVQEDDLIIPHVINIKSIVISAPQDWEILQLHTSQVDVVDKLFRHYRQGRLWVHHEENHTSAVIYVIRNSAAKKLLAKYYVNESLNVSEYQQKPVTDLLIFQNVRTYTLTFPIVFTEDQSSNIHSNHLSIHQAATQAAKKIHLLPANSCTTTVNLH